MALRQAIDIDASSNSAGPLLGWFTGAGRNDKTVIDAGWVTVSDSSPIASYVAAISSHPGLYGWYLFDEPEFNGVTPAQLKVEASSFVSSLPAPLR
jgi:hypothetical protein